MNIKKFFTRGAVALEGYAKDKAHLIKTIESCENYMQWLGAEKVMDHFVSKHRSIISLEDITHIVDKYYNKGIALGIPTD